MDNAKTKPKKANSKNVMHLFLFLIYLFVCPACLFKISGYADVDVVFCWKEKAVSLFTIA